jgi:hypothetical protein
MVDVLSFEEVQRALLRGGFQDSGGRKNDKALRFVHSKLDQPVFLKLSEAANPTTNEWLVIHPKYDGRLPPIPGMMRSKLGITHSTGYVDFPKRKNQGKGETQYGIDLGFADQQVLGALLEFLSGGGAEKLYPTIEEDIASAKDLPADATERDAVIAARRGQGRFRKSLEAIWSTCAVTGCSNSALLRASHIKPWRDSDNHDRLCPYNGLLLSAQVDAAFDKGLISFSDDGSVLVNHHRLSDSDASAVGIHPAMRLRSVDEQHKPYLAVHRRTHDFEK